MKTKFTIGQQVKVISERRLGEIIDIIPKDAMMYYKVKFSTSATYYYTEKELELIQSKFIKGDIVYIKKDPNRTKLRIRLLDNTSCILEYLSGSYAGNYSLNAIELYNSDNNIYTEKQPNQSESKLKLLTKRKLLKVNQND